MILLYLCTLAVVATLSGLFFLFGHRMMRRWSRPWLRCVCAGSLMNLIVAVVSAFVYLYATARSSVWPPAIVNDVHTMTTLLGVIYAVGGFLGLYLVERAPSLRGQDER